MPLIELKGVTKEFKKKTILRDVNITINEEDLFGIIGTSGSGKTTLLNIISGFIEPTEGKVLYYSKVTEEPQNLYKKLAEIKKEIGFTPQHNSFYPKLTIKENMWHFGKLYGIKNNILKNNIQKLLEITHLSEHQDKLAEELSGGMQKRLDISCSLIHKPKILVLDEPTADLDPILQKEITALLQHINKHGITIVLASHHLDCIEKICNKIALVHNGMVKSHGLLDEVRKPHFKDHFTITIRSRDKKEHLIKKLKKMPIRKIVDKEDCLIIYPKKMGKTVEGILTIIKDENLELRNMDIRKPSLNEVFEKVALE